MLVSTIDEAFAFRTRHGDVLLIGEVDGFPIEGFDLPNSPCALRRIDLRSRRLVHRTTAGTQGATLATSAHTLLVSSLCVARATADHIRSLNPDQVTFVETGVKTSGGGEEDTACADYLAGLLDGSAPDRVEIEQRVRQSEAARKFVGPDDSVFPAADLEEALRFDDFDFAMQAPTRGVRGWFSRRLRELSGRTKNRIQASNLRPGRSSAHPRTSPESRSPPAGRGRSPTLRWRRWCGYRCS